jgi:glycosyltransferase involved in cell wall biosynthesis
MWCVCEKQFMIMPDGKYCHQTKIDTAFCQAQCNHRSDTFTIQRTAYLKTILNDANLLLTPSTFQKEMYAYNLDHKEKLKVNRNGILFPSKEYSKKKNERVRFAYVGGNANHKGFQFLKDAFETIEDSNYELVLVDLERKLGHNSIFESDWDIKGTLTIVDGYENTQEGIDAFYSDIDVLLFPSQCKESFGLTVREVMVRDVWVISTDAGGVVEEIQEGQNGNLVAMNDSQMFQEKIVHFIENFDSFQAYSNPHKNKIRSYEEQTDELIGYYTDVLDTTCPK